MREKIAGRFEFPRVPGVSFGGESSRTKQSFAKEADINHIVAKARRTSFLVDPSVPRRGQMFYGDFTLVENFHELRSMVATAEQEFMRLPARLRDRFENNPDKFMAFLNDPANVKEAVQLGLLPREALPKEPVKVPKANPNVDSGVGSAGAGAVGAGAP